MTGRTAGGQAATPWLVIGLAGGAITLTWLAWASGRLVGWIAGAPAGVPFGAAFAQDLIRRDWTAVWPNVSPAAVIAVFLGSTAALSALLATGWIRWKRRRAAATARTTPTGSPSSLRRPAATDGKEPRRRTSLPAKLDGATALAIPALLAAPGAALATSSRSDLWAATAAARSNIGRVWMFDPQGLTHQPQQFWWNPLRGVQTIEDAHRLADHFVQRLRTDSEGLSYWAMAAQYLLSCLFLAAASSGRTILDVHTWLAQPTSTVPIDLLRQNGHDQSATVLSGRQRTDAETRDAVYDAARSAAGCLANPQITAWVTPPAGGYVPEFDPQKLPISTDTLYLLSNDEAGGAAPLVAGLTDQVLQAGVRAAEARGGRLDPGLVAILDEATNIVKISNLPDLYAHFGSRPMLI